jgi:hypothetical protein
MARLESQIRLGFFPLADAAVDALLRHLEPPAAGGATAPDPCRGAGAALGRIAGGLGVGPAGTFGVELDIARSDQARAALPGAAVLGPCSCLSARITGDCFSLVYCNPPFSDELGFQGRQEKTFASRAIGLCRPGGVVALVAPEDQIAAPGGYGPAHELRELLAAWLDRVQLFRVPEPHRPYKETVALGVRRAEPRDRDELGREPVVRLAWEYGGRAPLPVLGDPAAVAGWHHRLPPGRAPRAWEKAEPTGVELAQALAASPLAGRHLAPPRPEPASQPQSLGDGHRALLLTAGFLNGMVRPPGGPPHVVRGVVRKERFLAERTEAENEDGSKTVTEKYAERPLRVVRTLEPDGTLRTFEA